MAMRVQRGDFLDIDGEWKPDAQYIASKMMLDFESSVYSRMRMLGMDEGDLAQKMGLPKKKVSRMLSGESDLTVSGIANIAEALGCTVSGTSLISNHDSK